MKTFVTRVIEHLKSKKIDYKNAIIVVPSERMISYLQAAIFEIEGKPILAPQIVTIDNWVQKLVPYAVIDKTELILDLYHIFIKNPVNNEEMGFDKFLSWAQMLLSDFDEIDRYCVNPKQLFKNLKDVKDIENWSFNTGTLSIGQQQFMAFWEKLGYYYEELTKHLAKKQVVTKGKAYQFLSENIDLVTSNNQDLHLVFAGFNAMSKAELSILRQLYNYGKASILIDSDLYYFTDSIHEAGRFHRDLCNELQVKELPFIENKLTEKKLSIELIECPQITAQAQVIGSELLKLNQNDLNETLLLLADESLLSSIVRHLPAQINQANITVGLPLKQTSLRSWVDLIFKLQESFDRKGNQVVYHRDFTHLIHHPFVLGMLSAHEMHELQKMETHIIANKRFYIKTESIKGQTAFNSLCKLLFTHWKNDWRQALKCIQQINCILDENLSKENELERAIVQRLGHSIQSFQNIVDRENLPEMSLNTFKLLLNSQWSAKTVAYYGNPIEGLQVMGLLETRGLDFKNILVVGMNEGAMPPQNSINSLIPMDLRRYYGMPTLREKQGLFAHHFYRLLHHAEKMVITYSAAAEVVGSSEPSRYIQQLSLELANTNRQVEINKSFYLAGNNEKIGEISIPKSEAMHEKLLELLKNGISYSLLNTYLTCPLDFYYKYVVGLRDDDELVDTIQVNTFGTIVHYVLEELFSPFYDKELKVHTHEVTVSDLNKMKLRVPELMRKGFEEKFSKDKESWESGANHINFEVAKSLVDKYLDQEKERLVEFPDKKLFMVGLEESLSVESSISIDTSKPDYPLKFKGVCDRIEQYDGKYRIIDYKTGNVKADDLEFSKPIDLDFIDTSIFKGGKKKYVLQLFSYIYLYYHNKKVCPDAGIYSFVNMKESPLFLTIKDESSWADIPAYFEKLMQHIVLEMFSLSHFEHDENAKYCSYCSVKKKY